MPAEQTVFPIFTDAPVLHRNPFVGSFQLLFWLFFHPTAWCNHLAEVAPDLQPNFCLAELRSHHRRNLSLWRLLLMTYLAWPIVVGVLIALGLMLFGLPGVTILIGVIVGLAVGVVISAAAAFAGSIVAGVAIGMAASLVIGMVGILGFGTPNSPVLVSTQQPYGLLVSTIIGLTGGLSGGLAFGVAAGVGLSKPGSRRRYSLLRLIGGVIVGIVIGALTGRLTSLATGTVTVGMAIGVPFGVAVWGRTRLWGRSMLAGWLIGIAGSLTSLSGLQTNSVLEILATMALLGSLFSLPFVLATQFAGPWAGAMAGALGAGGGFFFFIFPDQSFGPILLFSLGGVLLGLTLAWWRPIVLYPLITAWNLLLYRLDERRIGRGQRSLLRWHSAFWDEFQRLPLYGLANHLLLVLLQQPVTGFAALEYFSTGRQRWAAQEAQIELDALQLSRCTDVAAIAAAYHTVAAGELAGPASALLRSFVRISQDVDAALRQESLYNQRLTLSAVEDRLNGLLRELTRSNEQYAGRFRPIAAAWRLVLAESVQHLAAEAELRQEIDSPYIIGVPLTEQQEIFIGRTDISSRIEQLLLDRRQPPLLLYGQRRVGKTSLLNNLGRLLPSTLLPLFVDLQGPASRARDNAGFLYNMARGMVRSAARQRGFTLPQIDRDALVADPFTQFDEWLDEVEDTLAGTTALLMLDEFEVLATALDKKRFDGEAVLGMFRHLIQHRPRFKVLLSGSHTLDEFHHWASYLINVQVVHIGHLLEEESRQLIEHPVRDFALSYEAAATQRVIDLTRGHPFLVQLLCAEIVALKNEQPPTQRRLATPEDVEAAVPAALAHGSFFFADIEQNQVDDVGRAVLRLLSQHPEGVGARRQELVDFVPSLMALETALAQLQHRELIESCREDAYRFQVDLVRRWFAERP